MSLPVPCLPGDVRHDIRNTSRGKFLFVPTELIIQAFQFILATAARRFEVGIVAYAMMCTHIHVVVVDLQEEGKASDICGFRRFLRSTFAQFIKAYWDLERGQIFCGDSKGSTIKVVDFASLEEAIAYVETNPMAAGMEKSPELMKGAVSLREWLLKPKTIERPNFYFQRRSWESEEELHLVVPPSAIRAGYSVESYYEVTKAAVDSRVLEIRRLRAKQGLKARPLRVLRRMRPDRKTRRSSADHSEVLIACQDPVRAAIEFARIRDFRRKHARAMQRLRRGDRDVVFPRGTYLAAKRYGVRVDGDDPDRTDDPG